METMDAAREEFRPRARFDESKHKRGKGGRFAKKAVKALFVPAPIRNRNKPETDVFRRHENNDVTHVSDDGTQRLIWNANTGKYDQQVKRDDGSWESLGERSKLQAYLLTKFGWKTAGQGDQLTDDERNERNTIGDVNAPAPISPLNPAPGSNPPGNAPSPPTPTPTPPPANPPAAPSANQPHTGSTPFDISNDYPTQTDQDMRDMQAEMEAQSGPVTPEQEAAIRNYSLSGYHDMNDCLRTGNNCTADATSNNAELEAALRPTTRPFTSFRSTNLSHIGGAQSLDDLRALVGGEISDSGFTSTSVDPSVTDLFGDVDLQIEVPVGTRATFPGDRAAISSEQEMILAPNTRYRVVEVNTPNPPGRPAVRLQVVT